VPAAVLATRRAQENPSDVIAMPSAAVAAKGAQTDPVGITGMPSAILSAKGEQIKQGGAIAAPAEVSAVFPVCGDIKAITENHGIASAVLFEADRSW
jgi:hypothetical protein